MAAVGAVRRSQPNAVAAAASMRQRTQSATEAPAIAWRSSTERAGRRVHEVADDDGPSVNAAHGESACSPVSIGEPEPRRSEQLRDDRGGARGVLDAEKPEDLAGREEERHAGEPEGKGGRDEDGS